MTEDGTGKARKGLECQARSLLVMDGQPSLGFKQWSDSDRRAYGGRKIEGREIYWGF